MPPSQTLYKNLPEKKRIWSLTDKGDFQEAIDLLSKAGVHENDFGEVLFDFGNQACKNQNFTTAIAIFMFLTDAVEDKSEALPLFKRIGDIYILISEYKKAREYYGKLPLTIKNIKLCFQTFIPTLDIDGLLCLRDTILSRTQDSSKNQIHTITNEIMMVVAAIPEIFQSHHEQEKQNRETLKKVSPYTSDFTTLQKEIALKTTQSWKPTILRVSETIYTKRNDIWHKLFSHKQQTNLSDQQLGASGIIMFFCNSPESLFSLVDGLQTDNPKFIRHECRIIIDFNLCRDILSVYDLSPLNSCNFVIRFIDKTNLNTQLTNLMLERNLPFANKIIYLSEGDHSFFSQKVSPILKKCEEKMTLNISQYEQQLSRLFSGHFHTEVINKITAGKRLRILLYASKFTTYMQHSIRDIAEGFRQLGHETFIEIEDEDAGVGIRKDVSLQNLLKFKPDILFEINHFRYERVWVPQSIPFVTWIQDLMPHILTLSNPALITEQDHIFSFSQNWVDNFFKTNPVFNHKRMICLPITISNNEYYPIPSLKKKYDVTFVSHLPDPSLTFLPILENNPIPEVKSESALSFLRKLITNFDDLSLTELFYIQVENTTRKKFVDKTCKSINIPFTDELFKLTESIDENKMVSRFSRHIFLLMKTKPILALISNNIDVKVFGENWEKLPQFKNIAMGVVKNGEDLNTLINGSRINLNLSPGTSYHMKAPEVIAARSFMLTRKIPKRYDTMPITDFFKEGKEIILFDDAIDLIEKTSFFLKNKKQREAIANAAYQKFTDSYGVKKTAQFVLNRLVHDNKSIETI